MLRVVRNFYDDPDEMRRMAISSKYELINWGNYIGSDTVDHMVMTPELKQKIKRLFPENYHQVTCSRFRKAIDGDTHLSYVHIDSEERSSGWHILIYLTKDADVKDGLVFYDDQLGSNVTCVQEYDYNMAVIVDYSYFHAPMHKTGFGDCVENSRLLHIIEVMDTRTTHYKEAVLRSCVRNLLQEHPDGRDDDH
jgi:hypothetical protein